MATKPSAPTITRTTSPYSLSSVIQFINNNFALLLLAGLIFITGFYTGSVWTENQMLKNGTKAAVAANPDAAVPTAPEGPTAEQLAQMPDLTKDDHRRGGANAQVVLVEYSDYECPFCARFHPTMVQVLEEFGDKVAWVYRHYPLSFHPQAQKSAEGAECVAKLGGNDAFWKYSDEIIAINTKNNGLVAADITTAATAAGVNTDAFKKCLDSGEMAQKVKDQMDGGASAGVNGTPGTIIVVDGVEKDFISGALPYEQIKATLDTYIQ